MSYKKHLLQTRSAILSRVVPFYALVIYYLCSEPTNPSIHPSIHLFTLSYVMPIVQSISYLLRILVITVHEES